MQRFCISTLKEYLRFSPGNSKLQNRGIAIFSLPAGETCPGANECLARFDRTLNKIIDGPKACFRCYAASQEAVYPSLRKMVDRNFELLKEAKTRDNMANLIHDSLPGFYFDKIRMHVDGDFYNLTYFQAWLEVARAMPNRLFYAYTKSLHYWEKMLGNIPENVVLKASRGGKFDHLIEKHDLPNSRVVFHPDIATRLGLEIDHDDSLAMDPNVHAFALLLHGQQKKGSDAAQALKQMRTEGIKYSYGKGNTPAQSQKQPS